MNKLTLSVAVAVALGLTGCGGDSLDDIKQDTGNNTVKPYSRVVFDPGAATPRLSVPNDLLFQGTTDGTLTTDSGAEPDYTNPQVALGALDGWSTQNPFTIAIDFSAGITLDAASASQQGAVRVFEIVSGGRLASDADCRQLDQGHACKVVGELTFGVDFVSGASGNNVAIIPLRPLKSATTYMLVLTNVLKDSAGNSIAPSSSYELVSQDDDELPLSTPSQISLQKLINSFEDVVEASGVNRSSIIYTAAITTQSTDVVFNAIKQMIMQDGLRPSLMVAAQNYTAADALVIAGAIPASQANLANPAYAAATTAQVYGGVVTLPYFSAVPTDEEPLAPLSGRWLARSDSPVTLMGAIEAGLLNPADLGLTPEEAMNPLNLLGFDLGIDKSRHITKFNPVPKVNQISNVPVLMTVPDLAQINFLRGLQGQDPIAAPANGWPVVIFQHGITGNKSNALAIAGSLAISGYAMVAIDHVLHGDRGFTVDVETEDGIETVVINASTHNATDYMNLQSLLTTRDNVRQSIADILGVRLGLNFSNLAQSGTINPANVQFIGHSLGAIAGTSAIAMANMPVESTELDEDEKALIDSLYQVNTATLAMPGGAIANFLLESGSFGPLIKASVLFAVGGEEISTAFAQFATAQSGCGQALVPPFAACYNAFEQYLMQQGQNATIAALYAGYNQFAFAAQTVIDSGDPNNYAQHLVVSETPAYVIAVVGDGDENLPDQVIPNGIEQPILAVAAQKMPLAGTLPLARLLGVQKVDNIAGLHPTDGANALAQFTVGDHSSILSPEASAAATVEMQTQTVSFIQSGGTAVLVTNPAVLAPAN
jgi:Pla-1/cef family extracellular lipase